MNAALLFLLVYNHMTVPLENFKFSFFTREITKNLLDYIQKCALDILTLIQR